MSDRPHTRSRSRSRDRRPSGGHDTWTPSSSRSTSDFRARREPEPYSSRPRHDAYLPGGGRPRGPDPYPRGGRGSWRDDRDSYRGRDDRASWNRDDHFRRRSPPRSDYYSDRRSRSRTRSASPRRQRTPRRSPTRPLLDERGQTPLDHSKAHGINSRIRSRSREKTRDIVMDDVKRVQQPIVAEPSQVTTVIMKGSHGTSPATTVQNTPTLPSKPIPKGPRNHMPSPSAHQSSPVTLPSPSTAPAVPPTPMAPQIPKFVSTYRSKHPPIVPPDLTAIHAAKLALRMLDNQHMLSLIELEGAMMRTRVASEVAARATEGLPLYGYTLRSLPDETL